MVTNAAIAATLLRHACPARCGARRRSKTRQLGPAPCEPPMLRRRRRPRQSCQARRITQARQASPDKPHRMKGKIAATRWPSVASSGRGYAPSAGRHRWPARQLDASCRLSCRQIYADSGRHRQGSPASRRHALQGRFRKGRPFCHPLHRARPVGASTRPGRRASSSRQHERASREDHRSHKRRGGSVHRAHHGQAPRRGHTRLHHPAQTSAAALRATASRFRFPSPLQSPGSGNRKPIGFRDQTTIKQRDRAHRNIP